MDCFAARVPQTVLGLLKNSGSMDYQRRDLVQVSGAVHVKILPDVL
jgi:hypothetical protein